MRDAERVRRSHSGVLFGLFTGVVVCFVNWTSLMVAKKVTDWNAALEPALLAGLAGFVGMLAGARWGERQVPTGYRPDLQLVKILKDEQ